MASFIERIKKYLGLGRDVNYGSYYTIEKKTGEPVQVSYEQPAPPVTEPPPAPEPISSQEAAVDTKDDGIDLAAMTKTDLVLFARERGLTVTNRMKKQEIIDKINATL